MAASSGCRRRDRSSRNEVVDRQPVWQTHTAIHAASALLALFLLGERLVDFEPILDALVGLAPRGLCPFDFQKAMTLPMLHLQRQPPRGRRSVGWCVGGVGTRNAKHALNSCGKTLMNFGCASAQCSRITRRAGLQWRRDDAPAGPDLLQSSGATSGSRSTLALLQRRMEKSPDRRRRRRCRVMPAAKLAASGTKNDDKAVGQYSQRVSHASTTQWLRVAHGETLAQCRSGRLRRRWAP